MLLFWPCIWGLTLVYDFSSSLNNYFFFGLLFLTGSILMRSAGCIINDIVDRNFDKKVERTKNRPIASGKVSVKLAIFYTFILCILAFLAPSSCLRCLAQDFGIYLAQSLLKAFRISQVFVITSAALFNGFLNYFSPLVSAFSLFYFSPVLSP